MAKGNLFLGKARGKVGSVVFSTLNGKQVTRAKAETVKNPRTMTQSIQRMVLATSALAASQFKAIVDHSFQGVAYGANSLARFRKLNMQYLRQKALADIEGQADTTNFVIKGAGFVQPAEYIMSKGQLSFPTYNAMMSSSAQTLIANLGTEFKTTVAGWQGVVPSGLSYSQFLAYFGLEPGDQLTVCVLDADLANIVARASEDESVNVLTSFRYRRLIFRKEPLTSDSQSWMTAPGTGVLQFTSSVIDTDRSSDISDIRVAAFSSEDGAGFFLSAKPIGLDPQGICVIRSKEVDGVWLRSNALMKCYGEVQAPASYTWPTYGDAQTENLGSDMYLNNALSTYEEPAQAATTPAISNVFTTELEVDCAVTKISDTQYSVQQINEAAGFSFDVTPAVDGLDLNLEVLKAGGLNIGWHSPTGYTIDCSYSALGEGTTEVIVSAPGYKDVILFITRLE